MLDDYKIGTSIDALKVGDSLTITQTMDDRDLLLYLGLSNDNNPLYVQREYAKETSYGQPIVPQIILVGVMTSGISKHLPGPGSNVVNLSVNFMEPVFHGETITFTFKITRIDLTRELVTIAIEAHNTDENRVLDAVILAAPPQRIEK